MSGRRKNGNDAADAPAVSLSCFRPKSREAWRLKTVYPRFE
jgi:hypothetical protein